MSPARGTPWRVLAALLLGCALPAALAAPAHAGRITPIDEVRISVNDKALTRREVEQFRELQAQELRRQYSGEELETRLRGMDKDLTNVLVEDLLIESFAARLNITVSDKEIDERVDSIVRRQPEIQSAYSDEQLKRFVLKDLLRRRVLAREVDSRVHVTRNEVLTACRRQSQDGRELDVGHILVRGDTEEARKKLLKVREELEAGASFEALATQVSDDPSVADNKGRLGFISRGQFVKPFEDAAFSLAVGGISEPVQTRFGLHLIKVFGERSRGPVDCNHLDEVTRQTLENKVHQRLREERLSTFLGRLKEQADIRVHE